MLEEVTSDVKVEPALQPLSGVIRNQVILGLILLYRASTCKQAKEKGSKDCLWTHIFTFLCDYYQFFLSFFC